MLRTLIASSFLFLSVPALACPMADAAAYQTAVEEVQQAEGTKITLKVEGLHCGDCSTKVTTALKGVQGVNASAVDYQTGEAKIAFDGDKTNTDALIKAIAEAGYTATLNS